MTLAPRRAPLRAAVLAVLLAGPAAASPPAEIPLIPAGFSRLVETVGPAVVNIRAEKSLPGGGPVIRRFPREPGEGEPPLQEFFERFLGEEIEREFRPPSLGSGFLIDPEGLVVTNHHVVEDADRIRVKLGDDHEYDAEVVGRDPSTDLALLRIVGAKAEFPVVRLGDSNRLKVGDWVVAIGSPFGLERTVTAGIVSAKGRAIGSGPYDDFIQTDASINPGNSGGPQLNLKGEVVGINTAIVAGGQGIGFAIPVNLAKGIIAQLKSGGEVTRGWLGVAIQDLTPEMADYHRVEPRKGVFVSEVFAGDPAEQAGIRPRDIIVEVGGRKVETSRQLTGLVAGIPVGREVEVKVLREGKPRTLSVKVGRRGEAPVASRGEAPGGRREETLGLRVAPVTPEAAGRLELREAAGVVVLEVQPGSRAARAGLRAGDVIREVDRRAVESVVDFEEALARIPAGGTVQCFLWRRGAGYLVVRLTR
ncbi:MAG: Do family serine endopeptidase [Desulfobacterales bacterium]